MQHPIKDEIMQKNRRLKKKDNKLVCLNSYKFQFLLINI